MLRYVFNIENNRTIKGYRDISLIEKFEIKRSAKLIFADILEVQDTKLGVMTNLKLYYPDGTVEKAWVNICADNPLKNYRYRRG